MCSSTTYTATARIIYKPFIQPYALCPYCGLYYYPNWGHTCYYTPTIYYYPFIKEKEPTLDKKKRIEEW